MDIIYNENLWTIGHFFMWMFIGRYLLKSWFCNNSFCSMGSN